MNDVIEHTETQNLPAVTTEQAMIHQIAEMAKNPDIDPDRIEKLLNVQIRMMDRQAKIDYDQALANVQMKMPRITASGEIKNRAGEITSRYMRYEDIDRVIRPLLQAEGFSLIHDRTESNDKMIVTTTLKHRSGHQESVSIPLPFDQTNALKSALQAAASTATFGKRHNVCSLLNIVAEGEDVGGVVPSYIKLDVSQIEEINKSLQATNADVPKFLEYMGVPNVESIPMKDYPKAFMVLKRKATGK